MLLRAGAEGGGRPENGGSDPGSIVTGGGGDSPPAEAAIPGDINPDYLELTGEEDKEETLAKMKSVNQLMEKLKEKRRKMLRDLKKKEDNEAKEREALREVLEKKKVLKKAEQRRKQVEDMKQQLEVCPNLLQLCYCIFVCTFMWVENNADEGNRGRRAPPSVLRILFYHERPPGEDNEAPQEQGEAQEDSPHQEASGAAREGGRWKRGRLV